MYLEDAQLSWQLDNQQLAITLLQQIINSNDNESAFCRVIALRLYGIYLVENKSNTLKHSESYFKRSINLIENIAKAKESILSRTKMSYKSLDQFVCDNRVKAYETIAKYADREYIRISEHMRSSQFEKKKQNIEKYNKTVKDMRAINDLSSEGRKSYTILKLLADIDQNEINASEKEQTENLLVAISNYINAAVLKDDSHISLIARIISLWFANKDNKEVTRQVEANFLKIASYKFLPVMYQIAARMSNNNDSFSNVVGSIVGKCFFLLFLILLFSK